MITPISTKTRTTIILLILVFIFYSCKTGDRSIDSNANSSPYTIIIDAGSTGSRIYIYKIGGNKKDQIPKIKLANNNDKFSKVKPGISEFEDDKITGSENIKKLLNRAKHFVDPEYRKQTPIYLLATAGMRLYSREKRNRILQSINTLIKNDNSFNFKAGKTISGRYEGLYGWLTINYLDDQFDPDPSEKREGLLEMGGASTQIAYLPNSGFKNHKLKRKINGKEYNIYSRSFLYLGINEVIKSISSPHCYSTNYKLSAKEKGQGDCEECILDVIDKFDSLCENVECNGPHCLFSSLEIPSTDDEFYAVSSFYYTLSTLGFDNNIDFNKLKLSAIQVCESKFEELVKQYPKSEDYLHGYCLASTYFYLLFTKAYDFSASNTAISLKNQINNTEVNWTLGAALDIQMGYMPETFTKD